MITITITFTIINRKTGVALRKPVKFSRANLGESARGGS